MAKKDDLTPRQRQSQKLMRERAAKKKRKALMRRALLIGGGVLGVAVLGGGVWLWKSGTAVRTLEAMSDGVYTFTARSGFRVQSLYLEGRNRTSMEAIDKAMGVKKGEPILRVSLDEVRERLEKVESIKTAAVERALPDTLLVRVVEREPVAMWQNQGRIALVDDNGVVMNGLDITPYKALPLIIGEGAPKHVNELMDILATQPDLVKRFSSAIRVGDRRWNIRLAGREGSDVEVRLPEEKAADAWRRLAELQSHNQVLDRDIRVIDLRLEGKMFIKLSPEDAPDKSSNAKET